jgi:hypothetical protein
MCINKYIYISFKIYVIPADYKPVEPVKSLEELKEEEDATAFNKGMDVYMYMINVHTHPIDPPPPKEEEDATAFNKGMYGYGYAYVIAVSS